MHRAGAAGTPYAVVISFVVAWSTTISVLRPASAIVSKLRFLGLTELVFPFTLATGGGFRLKVALLTFGMSTFLVTSLARIVGEALATHQNDYLRSLGASRARAMYEVVILSVTDRGSGIRAAEVASPKTSRSAVARSTAGRLEPEVQALDFPPLTAAPPFPTSTVEAGRIHHRPTLSGVNHLRLGCRRTRDEVGARRARNFGVAVSTQPPAGSALPLSR